MLKQELRRTKKELAEQTHMLKLATDELQMRESIPEAQNESVNEGSTICKRCKGDMSVDDTDVNLHF